MIDLTGTNANTWFVGSACCWTFETWEKGVLDGRSLAVDLFPLWRMPTGVCWPSKSNARLIFLAKHFFDLGSRLGKIFPFGGGWLIGGWCPVCVGPIAFKAYNNMPVIIIDIKSIHFYTKILIDGMQKEGGKRRVIFTLTGWVWRTSAFYKLKNKAIKCKTWFQTSDAQNN